ncbi:MAG: ABC transporter permease [Gammaproteobacteria bacterium]|nr:ABC transporter permease [Gammaproteobacteria bacterium]
MNNPVLAIIVPRLATGIFILFGVSVLITLGIEALSGDVCSAILGQAAEPSTVTACQAQLGIDRPLHIRYIEWLGNVLQGEFGTSLANNREVGEQIGKRLGNTLFLALSTSVFAVPVGIFLGVIAALYRNSFIDHTISTTTLSTIASPEFFVAYILMAIFAVKLGWLPAISNVDSSMGIFERLRASALPVMTLALVTVAHMMRMTRASIVSLLASPYIEMAKLKGLKPSRIIVKHALPNAWSPIIQVIVLNLAYMIVGVVVIEVVFFYPGLGALIVDAVLNRDLPVIQGTAMVFATAYVLLFLLADILSMLANPRLRHRR